AADSVARLDAVSDWVDAEHELLTVAEASAVAHVSSETIRRWAADHRLARLFADSLWLVSTSPESTAALIGLPRSMGLVLSTPHLSIVGGLAAGSGVERTLDGSRVDDVIAEACRICTTSYRMPPRLPGLVRPP